VGAWVGDAVVAGGAVVVADVGVVVVAAVVGGWTAGSDFSPQPVPAPASPAVTSMSGSSVRRPRTELTAGHANELD
jgi:hypothetical protein